jgi:hypothetical protein
MYNYIIINNNAVIYKNYARKKDLILLFKNPMGTRKDFLLTYTQFGHAPPKSFASPGLRNLSRRLTLYENEQVVGETFTAGIFRKMSDV